MREANERQIEVGNSEPAQFHRWRRRGVRSFAMLSIAIIFLDAMPSQWADWCGGRASKQALSTGLSRFGLGQGEWSMFAPDPYVNNGWFTADIFSATGKVAVWNSPRWADKNCWEKFVGFRLINFFNRLGRTDNLAAAYDYTDYIARSAFDATGVPVEHAVLTQNKLRLATQAEGSFPSSDEAEWILTSEVAARASYAP